MISRSAFFFAICCKVDTIKGEFERRRRTGRQAAKTPKKAMKNVMRVLAFVSALLCVGCISTQALTSLGDIDIDITREFNYKDQEEADANPLPKEIEENGNTYVLDEDSVDYQQRELNTKYQETVEYTDLTVKEVPQTYTVTLGGEQYELPLEDVQYTEEQADIPTEMTVEYKGEDKKPNAPQNKTFTLDDGTEVEGVLKEVNEVEDTDTWVDFTIDGQVVIPEGATAYVYLEKVHTYNPATPLWDGYKSDLMSAIGLNSDSYKITGGKWTSDPIARAEGGFYRTLSIYGQKNTGKSYVAVYETTAPIEIKYVASATYSMSLLSIGLDESFGNASELTICAIAHYVLEQVANANFIVGAVYRNRLIMPIMAVIFGISAGACGFVGFSKDSRKEEDSEGSEEI